MEELHDYGVGAMILNELGIEDMVVITIAERRKVFEPTNRMLVVIGSFWLADILF